MFGEVVKSVLTGKIMMVLEKNKAGRADARRELADEIVRETEDYLKEVFRTAPTDQRGDGIHQTRDVVDKDDYHR